MYKLNGLPLGWAWAPPLTINWLNQLILKGEKIGDKICFKITEIKDGLRKLKVPHVADTLEDKDLEYPAAACTEEEI